jgi:hypothetical protein
MSNLFDVLEDYYPEGEPSQLTLETDELCLDEVLYEIEQDVA